MTNLEALKNLYVAMGGTASDVADLKLNAELISALSDVATGGGGGGGGGDSGTFVVNFDMIMGEEPEFTADKTYAEIIAANTAGQRVIGYFSMETGKRMTLELTVYAAQAVAFTGIDLNILMAGTPKLDVYQFAITANNEVTVNGKSFALTTA